MTCGDGAHVFVPGHYDPARYSLSLRNGDPCECGQAVWSDGRAMAVKDETVSREI